MLLKPVKVASISLTVAIILTSCGKSDAARAVDDQIVSIGEVTIESEAVITEIERAYQNLSEKEKKTVENYTYLKEARDLLDEKKALNVDNAIAKIGAVTSESGSAITYADKLYSELSDSQKKHVKTYNTLRKDKEAYIQIRSDAVEQLINGIGTITLSEECYQAIQAAESAYIALEDWVKSEVSNYAVLENARLEYDRMSPIQLNFYSISHDNLETPILKIDAENITDKVIKEYIVRIFAYDSDGIPCKVNFDDFTTLLRDTTPIKPGAHSRSEGYWQLYGEYDELQQIVLIPEEVAFYDGSSWKNPQSSALYAKYNEKLLEPDDNNIVQRR